MNLDDALYRAINSRGNKLDSELVDVPRTLAALEAAHGGPGRAAAALGIPGRTWRRWKSGANAPTRDRVGVLQRAERRLRLTRTREKFLRGNPQIAVRAVVQVSSDIRERKLLISGWPDRPGKPPITGMMNDVLDAWLDGRDIAASDAFTAPIEGGVDGDLRFHDVSQIRFFPRWGDALGWSQRA